ncbi:MAG: hypothetical protein KF830_03315 [Planctomycetes bacterium]|nr:hypothetical protein [Planctomycetota bacterium]
MNCRRLTAALAALAAAGCTPDQAPDDRLLVVDGIAITLADVEPYVAWMDAFLPEGGRKAKVLRVIDEHLLPLRLAQRAFPEQRQRLREQAQALCSVATNAHELDEQSRQIGDRSRRTVTRLTPRLPAAMFLFDPARTGAVSPPLEVPYGWIVAAAFDLTESALAIDDIVDALQVGFMTHDAESWGTWLRAERQRIAATVTHVHPDYREAMPEWLQLPRTP